MEELRDCILDELTDRAGLLVGWLAGVETKGELHAEDREDGVFRWYVDLSVPLEPLCVVRKEHVPSRLEAGRMLLGPYADWFG